MPRFADFVHGFNLQKRGRRDGVRKELAAQVNAQEPLARPMFPNGALQQSTKNPPA